MNQEGDEKRGGEEKRGGGGGGEGVRRGEEGRGGGEERDIYGEEKSSSLFLPAVLLSSHCRHAMLPGKRLEECCTSTGHGTSSQPPTRSMLFAGVQRIGSSR